MPLIELPRSLEDYFAFAEIEPTRNGRRFSISLPYYDGTRLERLQWWYHISPAQEQTLGSEGIQTLRNQALERFRSHIERWLENTGQRLHGSELIPCIAPQRPSAAVFAAPAIAEFSPDIPSWANDKAASG